MIRLITICAAALLAILCAKPIAAEAIPLPSATAKHRAVTPADPYFPTYGNSGYDAQNYVVNVAYKPSSKYLDGSTTISALSTQRLTDLEIDLGLKVSSVKIDGLPAQFVKSGIRKYRLTPQTPIESGKQFEVQVTYGGYPAKLKQKSVFADGNDVFLTRAGEALAYGEPESAPWWFAANDHPSDKATYDVTINVPAHWVTLSNGRLASSTKSMKGKVEWRSERWLQDKPQAAYLTLFAAGDYVRTVTTDANGFQVVNAYPRALTRKSVDKNRKIRRAKNQQLKKFVGNIKWSASFSERARKWLASQFGEYPFTSSGLVATRTVFGSALEMQTRPVYGAAIFFGRSIAKQVVVHELAHQWFGDSVTPKSWRDVWLNEGFASFAEWLYDEHHGGFKTSRHAGSVYQAFRGDKQFWRVKPGDPGRKQMFSSTVYARGAMALQVVRHQLGDQEFLKLMRSWTELYRYKNASVQDFVALILQQTGKDLAPILDKWLYKQARPSAAAAKTDGGMVLKIIPGEGWLGKVKLAELFDEKFGCFLPIANRFIKRVSMAKDPVYLG